MRYVLLAMLVVAGMLSPVQMATNKRMAETVRTPVTAVAIALTLGTASLWLVLLSGLFRRGQPSDAPQAPWWAWLGGFLVAYSVTVEVANMMRHGVGPLIALIVAGNLISAIVIDHFGWFGMKRDAVNWFKLSGAVLLVAGAALMQLKSD